MISYLLAQTDKEYEAAGRLFVAYAKAININLNFQKFDDELRLLQTMYGAPFGGIILVKDEENFIGCTGIRRIDDSVGELKRMYIEPAYQGKGIAKILLSKALNLAKEYGYTTVRLDTLNYMLPAINLYKQNGFYEIPAYYYNPIETAVYFEKVLE